MTDWRPIPTIQCTINDESEDTVHKAIFKIILCLNLALEESFGEAKYKKFAVLCSTIDESGTPIFELTCHEVEFMANLGKFIDGYYSKDYIDNILKKMVNKKFSKVINKLRMDTLFAASIVYDEQGGEISLGEVPLQMPLTTTSGLLFQISSMVHSDIMVDSSGLIFEHFPWTKFMAFNLDTDTIKVSQIHINVDNYEEWDFYYPEYEKEVEENRRKLQSIYEDMIEEDFDVHQIETPRSITDFKDIVERIIIDFKKMVEIEGYKLLHDDFGQPRDERICQTFFYVYLNKYCKTMGIDLTKEPETGRGPVDFRFSNGVEYVAHIELKKDANPKLEHGLKKQLPTYMEADEVNVGFILIFDFGERDIDSIVESMEEEKERLKESKNLLIEIVRIDARQKVSASRVK